MLQQQSRYRASSVFRNKTYFPKMFLSLKHIPCCRQNYVAWGHKRHTSLPLPVQTKSEGPFKSFFHLSVRNVISVAAIYTAIHIFHSYEHLCNTSFRGQSLVTNCQHQQTLRPLCLCRHDAVIELWQNTGAMTVLMSIIPRAKITQRLVKLIDCHLALYRKHHIGTYDFIPSHKDIL